MYLIYLLNFSSEKCKFINILISNYINTYHFINYIKMIENNEHEPETYIDLDFEDANTEKKNGDHTQSNDKIKSG